MARKRAAHLDSAAGTLTVAVVGTQSSTALADVTGTSISLLTLTFNVSSGANRTHAPVLSATALEFLNQGSFLFVSNQQAQINDARGGAQTDGQLTVEPVAVVGHLAHTDAVDMVNTAALSGSAVEHSVGVVELYSRAATGAAPTSSGGTQTARRRCRGKAPVGRASGVGGSQRRQRKASRRRVRPRVSKRCRKRTG